MTNITDELKKYLELKSDEELILLVKANGLQLGVRDDMIATLMTAAEAALPEEANVTHE